MDPNDKKLYMLSRDGAKRGVILNPHSRPCSMEGCTGMRIHVKWEDGRHTYPCSKGCVQISVDSWRII